MPEDPNETLGANRLTSTTQSGREPWQEKLSRLTTVPTGKVAQAALVTQGLGGSWAGQWGGFPIATEDDQQSLGPNAVQTVPYMLGRLGMQEINFAPYAHGTNRFGSKGGSLLGHPISFAVVGPTLKNWHTNIQWVLFDNVPATGLRMIICPSEAYSIASPPGPPLPVIPYVFPDYYGFDGSDWEARFPCGLYVVFTQTGEEGALAGPAIAGDGGLGDGYVNPSAGGFVNIVPLTDHSKQEIFRVTDITGNTVTLDPAKPPRDYFEFPALVPGQEHCCRQIMFLEPKATRCLAVPDSGNPTESKTFVVIPPERSLNADNQYPYHEWTANPFFEDGIPVPADGTKAADDDYIQMPQLPVPKPSFTTTGRLCGEVGDPAVVDWGPARMGIRIDELGGTAGRWIGSIVHITQVDVKQDGQLNVDVASGWQAPLESLLGWFEVVDKVFGIDLYVVRRIDEYDPVSGRAFWGPSLAFNLEQIGIAAGDGINLKITVHDSISSLWTGDHFDYDKVDSARLTVLIDPNWVKASLKNDLPGLGPNLPDRAIFDTGSSDEGASNSNADPGNLYDLGFRMVLFPAKLHPISGAIIPDFDRPVDSNEVVLNPSTYSLSEQWVEIDYANGLIRCSEAPKEGSDLWPTVAGVFTASDNPRGELVIFCSCVPYSREEGQLGTAPRATGVDNYTGGEAACATGDTQTDGQDVYGERCYVPLEAQTLESVSVPDPTIAPLEIVLTGEVADQLPQTGFIEILEGTTPNGEAVYEDTVVRATTWGYYGAVNDAGTTRLRNIWGGGLDGASLAITAGTHVAVLRRSVQLPVHATNGRFGTDYQQDTTYGQAKRGAALRFADAHVTDQLDGSVLVTPRNTLGNSQTELLDDLFSSWLLEGGELDLGSAVFGATVDIPYSEYTIIFEGKRITLPAGVVSLPAVDDTYYLYLEENDLPGDCHEWAISPVIPVVTPGTILMYRVDITGVGTAFGTVIDMRYPLEDIDQRVDIYVGMVEGLEPHTPHFDNLADAIAYASEIQTPESGNPGRHVHIKVVGYTDEDDTRVPIQIQSDGIMVTSNPRVNWTTACKVRWGEPDSALIDLNGHDDIVFRGVNFECTVADPGPDRDKATPVRPVFTNTGPTCNRVILDDNRVTGPAQGFFSVDSAVYVTTGSLVDSRITNNHGEALLDFGLYGFPQNPYSMFVRCVISGNRFVQDSTPGGMQAGHPETGGIVWGMAATQPTFNPDNVVSDNSILRFRNGIRVEAQHNVFSGNAIQSTQDLGVNLIDCEDCSVLDNNLLLVHTGVAAIYPEKRGLNFINTTRCRAEGNTITISGGGVGDREIMVVTGDTDQIIANSGNTMMVESLDARVHRNNAPTGLMIATGVSGSAGTECRDNDLGVLQVNETGVLVSGNSCLTTMAIRGSECTVEGNFITTDLTIGVGGTEIDDCRVVDNAVGGNVAVTGGQNILANNTVSGNLTVNVSTLHYNKVLGNSLPVGGGDITVNDSFTTVNGNRAENINILGGGCTASDNHSTSDFSICTSNTIATEACVVSGNYVGGKMTIGDVTLAQGRNGINSVIADNNVVEGLQGYATADLLAVTGNRIRGEWGIGAENGIQLAGDTCTVVGNNVTEEVIVAADTSVTGNRVGKDITANGANCKVSDNEVTVGNITTNNYTTVTGNKVKAGAITAGDFNTITGNEVTGGNITEGDAGTVSGNTLTTGNMTLGNFNTVVGNNILEGDLTTGTGCTVGDNKVRASGGTGGKITVGPNTTVNGNAADDDIDLPGATGCTVMGNRCANITNTGAGTPADPELGPLVTPVIGNRCANIWGGLVPAGGGAAYPGNDN